MSLLKLKAWISLGMITLLFGNCFYLMAENELVHKNSNPPFSITGKEPWVKSYPSGVWVQYRNPKSGSTIQVQSYKGTAKSAKGMAETHSKEYSYWQFTSGRQLSYSELTDAHCEAGFRVMYNRQTLTPGGFQRLEISLVNYYLRGSTKLMLILKTNNLTWEEDKATALEILKSFQFE